MDIVIKGMNMPATCDVCWLNYDSYKCIVTHDRLFGKEAPEGFDSGLERLPSCPLHSLGAHGRLIDADLLPNYRVTGPVCAGENDLGTQTWILLPFSTLNDIPSVLEASDDFVHPYAVKEHQND